MTPGRCSRAVRAALFAAACVLLAALGHVLMSGTPLPWWGVLAASAGTAAAAWPLTACERSLPFVTGASVAVQALLHTVFTLAQSVARPSPAPPNGVSFARQWAEFLTCGLGPDDPLSVQDALRIVEATGLGGEVSQPPPGSSFTDAHAAHLAHGALNAPVGTGAAGHDLTHMTGAGTTAAHGMPGHDLTHMAAAWATGTDGAPGHDMAGGSGTGMLAAHLLAALLCGLWLAHAERSAFRLLRAFAHRLWVPLRLLFALSALFAPAARRPRPRLPRDFGAPLLRGRLLAHSLTSRGPPAGTAVA